ncbi:unnamed protein product [Caenorhabditis bovis]|uniref:ABC transporter domain-containing protein n=1 Tax=Caenorhabditis bovis TaxID=2654633 RepID=A0A8S1F4Z1_9PELO|nr:unnamed protein product [Caenorhabditis bovis]
MPAYFSNTQRSDDHEHLIKNDDDADIDYGRVRFMDANHEMIGFWRQLRFLLWKCALVRKRQKFWLAVELIVPCILFIVIALVRTRNFDVSEEQCHFDSRGLPSAGLLPFIHSFFCSFSNKCFAEPTTGDEKDILFNDAGDLTRNESLIVDVIYYSSLQLQWIGENEKEFDELVKSTAEIIHWFAGFNLSEPMKIRVKDLFNPGDYEMLESSLEDVLPSDLALRLLNSSILPEAYTVKDPIRRSMKSWLGMFFGKNPLFCNDSVFDKVFKFDEGKKPSSKEMKLLCKELDPYFLMDISDVLKNASFPTANRIKILPYVTSFQRATKPFFDFLNKYSKLGFNDIILAVFCGNDPRDIIEQSVNPNHDIPVETPFEKMRKNTVSPGKQQHKNGTCSPVNYHREMNCSQLEGSLMTAMRPVLQGYILVTPENNATRKMVEILNEPLKIAEYVRNLMYYYPSESNNLQDALHNSDLWPASQCFLIDRFRFVPNEKELELNALCLMEESQYFSSIVFNMTQNASEFPDFVTYKIRHYPDYIDSTNALMDSRSHPFSRHQPLRDLKYLTYGFSFVQESVDRAIIATKANRKVEIGAYVQQEPFPCTTKDTFNVALFMPLFLLISFIFPSALLVKNIVYEKELRIKEQMRAMGLGDAVHFISWALISLCLNFISVLVISLVCKFARIFNNTDYTLLLLILIVFMFSSIAMSLFFSTLFTNANIATAATCVLWFLFFFPFQLKNDAIKTPTFNRIMLILPPTAMGNIFKLLESFNAVEEATWADLPNMENPVLGLSVTMCLVMLAVDTLVFLILAWYVSAIAPGSYGVRQPLYFPFTIRYWFRNYQANRVQYADDEEFDIIPSNDNFEAEPLGLKATVHINSLSKVYDNGTKALDSLNLRLYENQITGLLGHNGAGKSTTMSILCGLYSPSSGTAKIYSRDIRTHLRRVREILGICPQHNVLFSHLTVAEQLHLFAALKGCPDGEIQANVAEILESVSLTDKANKLAGTLSGGMKRRLSIGIAFIGGSKFVILDEPTAGVDVTARKDIWKLLQRNKKGRTILLSTHHMDEADVLSDRIAILSQGQLVTVGTSVFLKRKFGNNMTLTVCKVPGTNYKETIKLVEKCGEIVDLKYGDETEEEIVFNIPINVDSDRLEKFFTDFDERMSEFQFGQYGISAPTLQNIFVSLAPQKEYHVPKVSKWEWFRVIRQKLFRTRVDEESTDLIATNAVNPNPVHIDNNEVEEVKFEDFEKPDLVMGTALIIQHIRALLVGRFHYTLRSKRTFLFQVIIPLLLIAACETYVRVQVPRSRPDLMVSQAPLPLETSLFGNSTDLYVNNWDTASNSTSISILKAMFDSPGAGTRCAENEPKHLIDNAFQCVNINGSFDYTEDLKNISYNAPIDCGCVDYGFNCTLENWNWDETKWLRLNSTERVFDLSGRNLSQFRLITRNQQIANNSAPFFIGGFSLGHQNMRTFSDAEVTDSQNGWLQFVQEWAYVKRELSINTTGIRPDTPRVVDPFAQNVTIDDVVNAMVANLDKKENVKVWFNNKLWPSLPITSNILTNAILRNVDTEAMPEFTGILTFNHPMNKTAKESLSSSATDFAKGLSMFRITCLLLVLSMIPAGFTVYLVEDRVCEAFHLQIVGGLKKATYWATSFLYDTMVYIVVVIIIMLVYFAFGVKEFAGDASTFFAFALVFIVYGLGAILYAYVLQKRFDVPALSFVLIAIGAYFVGVVCVLTVILLENMMLQDPTLVPAHTVCSIVFLIIPQYCLGIAIFRGSMVYQVKQIGINFLVSINRPDVINQLPLPALLELDVMGLHVVVLFAHIFVAVVLLVFTQLDEFPIVRKRECERTHAMMLADRTNDDDEDVIRENNRVEQIPEHVHNEALVVRNLAKAYTADTLAVRGVSFAVEHGECFGLLGLNGAGKTTTFSMLTAKIWPGHGSIEMSGTSISSAAGKAVVLTSHSMEECEALCTRIAIMDRGRIRCLGGKQHLKNKFGKGFSLVVKMAHLDEAPECAQMLVSRLEGSHLEAIHCSTIFIHIAHGTSSIAQTLRVMNQVKKAHQVEDFTLSQSTLDNVFQSIAENRLPSAGDPIEIVEPSRSEIYETTERF